MVDPGKVEKQVGVMGELGLEMIDQAPSWGLAERIIVADAGYGDVTEFREELQKRRLPDALGVQSNTGVWREPPQPCVRL